MLVGWVKLATLGELTAITCRPTSRPVLERDWLDWDKLADYP